MMFEKNQCIIRDNHEKERVISVPRTSNNMFPLDVAKMENFVMTVRSQADEELWHLRLGHLNYKSLMSMAHKKIVRGMPELKKKIQCEECVMTKQARTPFPSGVARRASECLELVHMDLCGPMSEDTLGGNRYFYLLVDDYSRWCTVYFIKNKSEASAKF